MPPTTAPKPARIIGPVPFAVYLADGTSQKLSIRPLNVSELYEFIEFANSNKTPDLVCLITGKDRDWLDMLDPTEYGKLAAKCFEVNFERAAGLMADPVALSMMAPLLARVRSGVSQALTLGQDTRKSSAEPPPSDSGEATGPESAPTPSTAS